MGVPHLLVTVHPAGGQPGDRRFEAGSVVVGRGTASDLAIPDARLSRQHARLWQEGDGWSVEDLGSHNGTYLNGERLARPARLRSGDVLSLGGSRIVVKAPGDRLESGGASQTTFFRSATEVLDACRVDTQPAAEDDRRRQNERLRLLNEVHQALGRSISLVELLELILDRAFAHLRPQEGAIYLRAEDGSFKCAAKRSSAGANAAPFHSTHLVHEVAEKGLAALVMDVTADGRFSDAASIIVAGVQSLVAAPFIDSEGSLGMIVLASGLATRCFDQEDMELLTCLASAAALRIRNVALAEEAAEKRRLAGEIALARRIQENLLPAEIPLVPGWEIHAINRPSRFVSGDFYTFCLREEPASLALLIADVAGKGVAASLVTASLEALCAGPLETGLAPHAVFTRVSHRLWARTPPEKFVTAFLAVLEPGTGQLRCANAGHFPPLVIDGDGGHRWLRGGGVPLGLLPEATYEQIDIELEPGDLLVLYTDGFTEAESPQGEEFGAQRLVEACAELARRPLAELTAELERRLDAFTAGAPLSDDRTLVLLRRSA